MRFTDVAVLSQALASGFVLAKPIEKRQTGASTVQSVGSYSYVGCAIEPFANGGNGRTLTNTSQSTNTMTVESCASFCSDYAYFSVEWSSECYCGDELSDGTAIEADDTNCNFPCAGDSTEFCGGSAHQNLYSGPRASGSNLVTSSSVSSDSPSTSSAVLVTSSTPVSTYVSTTAAATTSTTSAVASGEAYKYVTCAVEPFQNGGNGRGLIDASTSNDAMTVEYCASYCAGYTFFAVEYSSQCYCGNTIQTGTTQDVGDHCNMPCSGNTLEQCGGAGVMNLYEVSSGPAVTLPTTYSQATSTSSSAAASTPASTSAVASTSSPSSAVVSTSASTSAVASTSTSSSAVASTSASTSAVASTSASTSAAASTSASTAAVASTSASASAAASTSKSSSAVASTSAASSSAPVSTSASSKPASSAASTSTVNASSAAPISTSSVTSSRSASSAASSFVTSTTAARTSTSTSSSAIKASTTATATASATPSSFFSIATCPKLSANLSLLNIKQTFTPYFSGSGVTENCINPGSSVLFPARIFQIAGTNNACAAATLCLQQMSNLLVTYQSFDLHYRTDTARWECVAYKDNNVQGSYFNVRNPAVSVAYGFNGVSSF